MKHFKNIFFVGTFSRADFSILADFVLAALRFGVSVRFLLGWVFPAASRPPEGRFAPLGKCAASCAMNSWEMCHKKPAGLSPNAPIASGNGPKMPADFSLIQHQLEISLQTSNFKLQTSNVKFKLQLQLQISNF